MKKLNSLSIFFPFFNDAGTVEQAITDAYKFGKHLALELEVIAIHGGLSQDNTHTAILKLKKTFPDLIIIDKRNNKEGYGVIKHGFDQATKDWVFYTDGDLQYRLNDLKKLVKKQAQTGADVINGYRKKRSDDITRVVLGHIYKTIVKFIFQLPITDLTCDFRLIRKSFLEQFKLYSHNSSIILELIKKLQYKKAQFAEALVHHYPRAYGSSSYHFLSLFKEKLFGDAKVWFLLFIERFFIVDK